MLSNASAIAAVFASSRVRVTPTTGDEGQAQGPLAGQDHSTQQHLVERMEAEEDDWATWPEILGADLCSYFQGPDPAESVATR
jgi:hypothetical protein